MSFYNEDNNKNLKQKVKPKKTNPILKQDDVMNYIQNVQTRFVLVQLTEQQIP